MNVYNFISDNIKTAIQKTDDVAAVLTPEI